jgi:hypothetical protein
MKLMAEHKDCYSKAATLDKLQIRFCGVMNEILR